MRVNVLFINVRANEKGVPAFQKTGGKFVTDAVGLFGGDLSGLKRLAHLIRDHVALLPSAGHNGVALFGEKKLRVGGVHVAGVGGNQLAVPRFLRILRVVRPRRKTLRDAGSLMDMHGNNARRGHNELSLPSKSEGGLRVNRTARRPPLILEHLLHY